MGVNMFSPGSFVNTPDGIGSILFYTDYKPVEVDGRVVIKPKSAVVLFDNRSANKYPMDQLTMAEQPQKEPSSQSPETVERTILDRESMLQDTLEQVN
jgi:hypothetical protein